MKKKNKQVAQAGPGYRPRPGSDSGGNQERMGTNKKWDPHMQMWVPIVPIKRAKRAKLKINKA